MLNDYQVSLLVQNLYDGGDQLDRKLSVSGVDIGIKEFQDCVVLIHEGSHDLPDAERDFDFPLRQIPGIGGVHSGFDDGVAEMLAVAMQYLPKDKPLKVVGHSLGAAESVISTARLAQMGYTLLEMVTWGLPYPGDAQLAHTVSPFAHRSYWNYHNMFMHDIIGDVPPPNYFQQFVMPVKRILIDESPLSTDPWGLLAWHHFNPLYLTGTSKLYGQCNSNSSKA